MVLLLIDPLFLYCQSEILARSVLKANANSTHEEVDWVLVGKQQTKKLYWLHKLYVPCDDCEFEKWPVCVAEFDFLRGISWLYSPLLLYAEMCRFVLICYGCDIAHNAASATKGCLPGLLIIYYGLKLPVKKILFCLF